jgi:hypothetical protein
MLAPCRWLVGALVVLGQLASNAEALNEATHELVNRRAAETSKLDDTLKTSLGFGIDTPFNGNSVIRWMELGGRLEDEGGIHE